MTEEQQEIAPTPSALESEGVKKRRIAIWIIAAIVTLIILIIIILSLVPSILGKASCKSVEEEPVFRHRKIEPIASQDNRVLVRFAGSIKLLVESPDDFDATRYVELKLQRVHHARKSNKTISVSLVTDCGTIDLIVYKDSYNNRYVLNDIYLKPGLSDYPFEECIAVVDNIYFGYIQYWSCNFSMSYPCRVSSDESSQQQLTGSRSRRLKRIDLQLDVFDLEMDGDPAAIESGYFNLEPKIC